LYVFLVLTPRNVYDVWLRLYGFADYHEICEYVAMAAFALSSQSYEPETVYIQLV